MIQFASSMQWRVYKKLTPPETDVLIEELFMCAYPGTPIERRIGEDVTQLLTNRDMQQYLASLFARMNTRLAPYKLKITPGRLKQTYRLSNIVG